MASTGLDFTNITPTNGAVQELKALIFENVLSADKLGAILNVLPKQKHGSKIGFIGEFGLIGKKGQGCNPKYNQSIISSSEKTWDIQPWSVDESICYEDLEGTIAQLALRKKTQIADLTGTEYLGDIVMPRLELAILKMFLRFAWFGDKAAETVDNGGVLKTGVDKDFFNVTDGLWKRIFAIVAADASRRITIDANTKATISEQKSALWSNGVATGILDKLISDAPLLLRQSEGQTIYITQTIKDALDVDIKRNNKGSELQWQSIFAGIKQSEYNGIPLVVIPFWDEMIQGYEGTEAKWNNPHRAIYTVKDNLLVGLESESELAEIDVWFEKKDQMNYIIAKDKLGTETAQDNLIQVAY